MTKISIIIAVYNEKENIRPLIDSIRKVFPKGTMDYEIIFVDDGSCDDTPQMIRDCIDRDVILIELKKNFGQSAALKAGIDHASGDYIATLDGDLQNDPVDLPMMMEVLIRNDCDIVTGIRADRKDHFILRRIPSGIANYMARKVTRTDIRDNGCGIKVFRSEILKGIPLYGERHRFLASLAVLEGASVMQVIVRHHVRVHGKSKYGLGRTFKAISELMLMNFTRKYGEKPMYLFGPLGLVSSLAGTVILIWLLIQKIMGQDIWGRPIMILGVLLMFIGFQIISTGLILDHLVRRDFEADLTKSYKIKRITRAE